ncbi:uncharacterized protein [Montipora capricornis]|uniref:uncharacterized protein n=1 Tax=Montipora capricornis TaxID=246305 RepID=UPI0035F1106C
MATPDSGDSNLPKESSNEICEIINCVAIYYEKGASGNAFLRKEKFRAQVSRKVRSLKALRETVSQFGGVRDVAKNIGLGSQITVKLARLDKSDSRGAQCFAINTDDQVALELPSIRTGTDMLQLTVYPIEIAFATNSQRIVVQVKTVEGGDATHPTPATSDNPHITLTEEEKLKLNKALTDCNCSYPRSEGEEGTQPGALSRPTAEENGGKTQLEIHRCDPDKFFNRHNAKHILHKQALFTSKKAELMVNLY